MPQTNSTVEERIVEMRFDNKQFESGVKQTMSTLDKLKEKLTFHNDAKGIEQIQNSVNRLDFSVAMRGLDGFTQRLSALQIFGKRIVENLADDFYGAIKKVENGIRGVFQQISTGGANRALNIEQAKFQLEGLHIAWEDIKGDIDYAVSGTAYGLDAAAKVAAQLSASQIQVGDDMKNALRGISGVAAMTNSTYEDIGRVFTQVAGAGRLYTQDMLQLSSRGLNVAAALANQLDKTEGEIRDMVTKGQIDFKTFSTAMNKAFGKQATKANDTYTGSLSNVKAALSRIGADIKAGHFETFRQVFVDLIPKLNEFKKAFKPVESVIIEVEAAVGRLIQKIISMVDVTKIVSRIAKPVEKVGKRILEVVDTVTAALEQVNAPLKAMKEFAYVSREAAMQMSGFGDAVKSTAKEEKEALNLTEDMQKAYQAAQDIWNSGKYGNGQARVDALRAAGIDPDKTQQIIEEFIKNGGNWEEAIKKVSESTSEAVDENSEKAEKLTKKVQTLATIFRNIKRTFKAVATSIGNIVSVLFKSISGTMENFGVGDILIKITDKIADLAEKFVITKEKAEKLTKPISLIQTIFKGIIGIGKRVVKFIFSLVTGIGKLAYSIAEAISGSDAIQSFIKSFSDGIKVITDGVKSFIDTTKKSSGLKKFIDIMKTIGKTILGVLGSALLKVVDGIGWVITHLDSFFSTLADIIGVIFGITVGAATKIGDFFKSIIDSIGAGTFIDDFKAKFDSLFKKEDQDAAGKSIFERILGFIKGVFDTVVNLFNQHTLDEYLVVIKEMMSIALIAESMLLVGKIQKMFRHAVGLLKSVDSVLKSTAKVNKSIANLNNAKAFAQIAKVILAFAASVALIMFTVLKTADYISSSDEAAKSFEIAVDRVKEMMGKIALSILGIIAAIKLTDLAISMFTSKTKLHVPILLQFGAFMFSIGYAIKQVLDAIVELADMDPNVLKTGGSRLAKIGAAIGGFFIGISLIMALINKFLGTSGGPDATKGLYAMSIVLIAMAVSIDVLMAAVSWISMMILGYGTETVEKAVKYIKGIIRTIMGMLSVLVTAMAFLEHFGSQQDLAKTFGLLALLFLSIGASLISIMIVINDLTLSLKLFPSETKFAIISVILAIVMILGEMIALVSTAAKIDDKNIGALKSLIGIIVALDALMIVIGTVTYLTDNDTKLSALGVMLMGLIGIVASMSLLIRNMGSNKLKAENIKATALLFASLGAIIASMVFLTKQPWENILAATSMLALVVFTMQYVIRALSSATLKAENIKATALLFASLGAIVVSLVFISKQPVENIAAAMLGLSLAVFAMSALLERLNNENIDFKNILALGGAFLGLAVMIGALQFLKGEDWPAIGAAMLGLMGVVGMFAVVMKTLTTTTTPGQIVAIGGSFAIMAAGLALLGYAIGKVSEEADTEGIIALTVALSVLSGVLTGVGVILGRAPQAMLGVVVVTAALGALAFIVVKTAEAISELTDRFPDFIENFRRFAYTLGEVPRLIKEGLVGGSYEAVDANSPSREFMKLGYYCIEGLLIGIKDTLVAGIRRLVTWLQDYIINPICEFFDIDSPSKLTMKLGEFIGEGLINGFGDTIKNKLEGSPILSLISDKIKGSTDDAKGLGGLLGNNFLGGLTDSLGNLGNGESLFGDDFLSNLTGGLSTTSLNVDDLIDTSSFKDFKMDGLSEAITGSAKEELRGIQYTDLYTLDDLLDNEQLYHDLKDAGETQLTKAYEDWTAHAEFMNKYPTYQSWLDDIENNYPARMVEAYRNGDEEIRAKFEAGALQNYIDQTKLSKDAFQYTKAYIDGVNKAFEEEEAKQAAFIGPVKQTKSDFIVNVKYQDEEGNTIKKGYQAIQDGTLTMDYDNSSVKTNMDSVSSNITSAVNAQTTELSNRLTEIENKVGTFDTNNMNRTNNLISRISLLESAIRSMKLQLDTGALVGQLVDPLDAELGRKAMRKSRG